jgi:amidase
MLLHDDPACAFLPYPAVAVPHAPDGPLAGLTVAVKDLYDVAGYPTGGGSPHVLAMSGVKTRSAPIAQKMFDAGARFVGKTHTDELAFSMNGKNAHFGTPVNGAAPERIPGGSSSGSASAVSNRLCDFALGSDTGGSVRAPANHCGLYGIRPTQGRVSLQGCLPLAASFDTPGYFTRDAKTFVRVAEVFLGPDSTPLPEKPRLLLATGAFAALSAEARGALASVVKAVEGRLGQAEMVEVAPEGWRSFTGPCVTSRAARPGRPTGR